MRWYKLNNLPSFPSEFEPHFIKKDFFILPGQRNDKLASEAGKLRSKGYSYEDLEELLQELNKLRCLPPLDCKEVSSIAESISNYENNDDLDQEKAQFTVKKLSELLLDTTLVEPTPIVTGLMNREEFHLCSATAKTGKTFLQIHLAISVAIGEKFLGKFECVPSKVLIVQTELSDYQFLKRFKLVAGGKISNVSNRIWISSNRIKLDTRSGLKKLSHILKELSPDLLILDPFYTMHTKNEDQSTDMAPILTDFKQIILENKCTALIIHHQGKGSREGQTGHKHRGSSSFADVPDGSWSLNREKETDFAKISFELRNLEPPGPYLLKKDQFLAWQVVDDYKATTSKVASKDVLLLVKDNPGISYGDLTSKITEEFEIGKRSAQNLIFEAKKYKMIFGKKEGRSTKYFECIDVNMHTINSDADLHILNELDF